MYKKLLIPTDGSPLSEQAVSHGVELARECGGEVVFVSVRKPLHSMDHEPSVADDMPEQYRAFVHEFFTAEQSRHLDAAKAAADQAAVSCELVNSENDHVYQGIIDTAADYACDLIVMASHGRRGVSAMILGSETTKVLTHSKIPVLVYR